VPAADCALRMRGERDDDKLACLQAVDPALLCCDICLDTTLKQAEYHSGCWEKTDRRAAVSKANNAEGERGRAGEMERVRWERETETARGMSPSRGPWPLDMVGLVKVYREWCGV